MNLNKVSTLIKRCSIALQSAIGRRVVGKRRIVVFESDDWGSIRMPSKYVYNALLSKGLKIEGDRYCKFDSIAKEEDLFALFECLSNHRDSNDKNPVVTTNFITGNPDFAKILESGFNSYHVKSLHETLQEIGGQKLCTLWKEGIAEGFICPQYHGRDHVHVERWLKKLRDSDKFLREAFNYGVFGIPLPPFNSEYLMAALDYSESYGNLLSQSLNEGLTLFKQFFDKSPLSFIAPCYIWTKETEEVLNGLGIRYLQSSKVQLVPISNSLGRRRYFYKFHWLGQRNTFGQIYLPRNCFFEPSLNQDYDWIDDCMYRVHRLFSCNNPAIISTHRVNFIGSIHHSNRSKSLKSLDILLQRIIRQWPNVEFMSSAELGGLYSQY